MKELREQAHKSSKDKLGKMLGKAEGYTDKVMEKHHEEASHLKPAQVAKIAEEEIKGATVKPRMDRVKRKKGGRAKKGDVNIIIAQKPDMPQGVGMPMTQPVAPPPRPVVMPPPQGAMPPAGMPPAGGAAGMPPPQGMPPGAMPGRKKGGKVKLDGGAGGGIARLEKAAEYGAKR